MTITTVSEREALLSDWIRPSSDSEKEQQDRAERMVMDAITGHPAFKGVRLRVYVKGSYPNNTNVRRDSDVDVVVEMLECSYSDYAPGVTPPSYSPLPSYDGPWTPTVWRAEVTRALVNAFGASAVDTSGKIALNISAVPGSRPSADVVPSFVYYRYDDAFRSSVEQGSCVFTTGGTKVVNWPAQQFDNGRSKNWRTNRRYKSYVRALKNAENALVEVGTISDLPSYFMECIVFNVPDSTLTAGSLDYGFQETLRWLWLHLEDGSAYESWVEPNRNKWLFKEDQKWSIEDGKDLVLATWRYLAYGN